MNTKNLRFCSNRVRDIIGLYHEELDTLYGSGEVSVFCDMLFEAYLNWDKVRLLTSKEQTIDQSDLLKFHWALEDLKKQRPIQHIIGHTDFCGCRIKVTSDVLIPRPETEEIVNWIISNFTVHHSPFSILDLCTGSGCIAIALKKAFPEAETTAVDISPEALEIAKGNAQTSNTEVSFFQADILASFHTTAHYQLIVSNPPYVLEKERAQMQRNVLDYDPGLALFVPDDDPLRFYKAIVNIAQTNLTKDGVLVLEINESLAQETCSLLHKQGFLPIIHDDFRGKHRFITSHRLF